MLPSCGLLFCLSGVSKQLSLPLCVPEPLLLFVQRLSKAQYDVSNLLLALAKLFATSGEESSVEEDRKAWRAVEQTVPLSFRQHLRLFMSPFCLIMSSLKADAL